MRNRTVTGHWGHETISRPKTLAERHPDMFKPKHKALEKTAQGKIILKKPRMLTEAESKEKTKHWPTGHSKALNEKEQRDYQHRTGRGYNE